jgi:1-acyl-sn-glycerol-3-phosphate acyltransferase
MPSLPPPPLEHLEPFERCAFWAMDLLHRRARGLTERWLRSVSARWMTIGSRQMMHAVGLERLAGLRYEDGILLVSNHRSFFDLYMLAVLLHRHTPLVQPVLCPVRADFFYRRALGVAVNLVVGGGRMFPPFFREPEKQSFNKWALDRVAAELRAGSVLVGFHPEGTRNRNTDPYEPLPAQPGIGRLVVESWPIIVPAFINGLTNDFLGDLRGNFDGSRKVIAVFGEPIDTTPYRKLGNRLTSHKRIADDLLRRVYALSEEERRIRHGEPARLAQAATRNLYRPIESSRLRRRSSQG